MKTLCSYTRRVPFINGGFFSIFSNGNLSPWAKRLPSLMFSLPRSSPHLLFKAFFGTPFWVFHFLCAPYLQGLLKNASRSTLLSYREWHPLPSPLLPGPALMVLLCAVSLEASAPCTETQPSVLSSKPALPPVLSRGNAPSSRVIFPAQPGGARKL